MDVDSHNLDEVCEDLHQRIRNAAFVSIDTELSGLKSTDGAVASLFDSSSERYHKIREGCSRLTILQFGLSIFQYKEDSKQYEATVYRFHICPLSFLGMDKKFIFQSSSIEFLCEYDFDFNKFAYEGLPFMNNEESAKCQKILNEGLLTSYLMQSLDYYRKRMLQEECDSISEWSVTASVGDTIHIVPKWCTQKNPSLALLLQLVIRQRFDLLWTRTEKQYIIVERITEEKRKQLLETENVEKTLEKQIIEFYRGFSRIVEILVEAKKPLVGHNVILDIAIMYNQFCAILPESYSKFKKCLLQLFPLIFDTKFISLELQSHLKNYGACFSDTSLLSVYNFFKTNKYLVSSYRAPQDISLLLQCSPEIVSNIKDSSEKFHDAAYDSYVTGYCFLHLGHIAAVLQFLPNWKPRPLSVAECFNGLHPFRNCINISRASISCINLEGTDPIRPSLWLFITSTNGTTINLNQLNDCLARYGNLEIQLCSSKSAVVVAPSKMCGRHILNNFKHEKYKMTRYSVLRHSPRTKAIFLCSAVSVSVGMMFWYLTT